MLSYFPRLAWPLSPLPLPLLLLLLLADSSSWLGCGARGQPAPRIPVDPNQQPFVYTYGFRRPGDAGTGRVLVEMHGDLVCKVCRQDWLSTVSLVLSRYSSANVSFVFHPFPLSFHRAGFLASKAGFVIESLAPGSFFNWVLLVFKYQDQFQNDVLFNQTDYQVVNQFADIAAANIAGVDRSSFMHRMTLPFLGPDITPDLDEYDMLARAQWKLSTTRGVMGTPVYFVNGVRLLCDSWTVDNWTQMLDFMLKHAPPA